MPSKSKLKERKENRVTWRISVLLAPSDLTERRGRQNRKQAQRSLSRCFGAASKPSKCTKDISEPRASGSTDTTGLSEPDTLHCFVMLELLHLDKSEQQAPVPMLLSRPPGLGKGGTGPFWGPLCSLKKKTYKPKERGRSVVSNEAYGPMPEENQMINYILYEIIKS